MKPPNLQALLVRVLCASPEQQEMIWQILNGNPASQPDQGAGAKCVEGEADSGGFEGLVTKPVVARKTHLSVRSIENLMVKGLPAYFLGRSVRFRLSEVEKYLAANCRASRRGASR